MLRFLKVLVLFTITEPAVCLDILAVISMPYRSHYMAFEPLFRELSNRGNRVTVINNYPNYSPTPNLKHVNISDNAHHEFGLTIESFETIDSSHNHILNFIRHLTMSTSIITEDCDSLFENPNVQLHALEDRKYDLVFVEQFLSDCALVYAAALYEAPIIGLTSHVLLPITYSRLGIPFDFASDPFYFSNCGTKLSLYHKIESIVGYFVFNTIGKWNAQRTISKVFNRYLSNYTFDVEDLARKRMKMVFSYQHFSLSGARVLAPQLLEVGGMHIGKANPLPENLEQFLSSAEVGVVYVSFGSNLRFTTMSQRKLQEFLGAFRKIPQKVLLKWENASFPDGYDNVYPQSWVPQLDILCHPKVIAFVSHGGMLSISEAAHCGTPVLAVPFFGDQFGNAAMLRESGLGDLLFFDKLNVDSLANGIMKLSTPEMQESAQRVSKLWHDRPQSSMDSAVYWTEYVARHPTAPPSLPSKHVPWFNSLLLDVYVVIFSLLLLTFSLLYVVSKLFLKIIFFLPVYKKIKCE